MTVGDQAMIQLQNVSHRYGERQALDGVTLEVRKGEIFGLLGPNGAGKSTLFQILSTAVTPGGGTAAVFGSDVRHAPFDIRHRMGVVFQHPGLDKKLTVRENLRHQGHLYGMKGAALNDRIDALLKRFDLEQRANDSVERLSGGLMRRVDLARGLLHGPELILLDEPDTGLDPGARLDFWELLLALSRQDGVTVFLTTHLLEMAEKCDRIAILSKGKKVGIGSAEALKAQLQFDVITVDAADPQRLLQDAQGRFSLKGRLLHDRVRFECGNGHEWVKTLVEAFPGGIRSIQYSRPTLEDVFIQLTGHRMGDEDSEHAMSLPQPKRKR